MKTLIIVQARVGSSRLPGKVLLPLAGKPLLIRMLERVSAASLFDEIVVASTDDPTDDIIEELCKETGFSCYRGHRTNLLDRHYKAAEMFGGDIVVKIPSDCPLIDPQIIDRTLQFYKKNIDRFDFVSNLHPATYPDGNDVEVVPFQVLDEAWQSASKNYECEHTTPFIWEQPNRFRIGNVEWETGLDYSMSHRFTIDYKEDYDFIRRVYDELWTSGSSIFSMEDILHLLEEKKGIYQINARYAGVNWYRNHIGELKTITREKTRAVPFAT
jgi:spore coat polysaccharide biosynthesis protein SpsF